MKKIFDFKNFVYLFFVLAWFLSDFDYIPEFHFFVFIFSFIISLVSVCFFKNKAVSIIIPVIVSIGMGIYKFEYLAFFLQPLLLTAASKEAVAAYKEKGRKANDNLCGTYLTLCLSSIVLQIICSVSNYNKYRPNFTENFSIYTAGFLFTGAIVLFVILFAKSSHQNTKKDSKVSNKNSRSFKSMYVVSVICLITTVIVFYYTAIYQDIIYIKLNFFGWYLYIITLFLNEDPFVNSMTDDIKLAIEKFVQTEKESK